MNWTHDAPHFDEVFFFERGRRWRTERTMPRTFFISHGEHGILWSARCPAPLEEFDNACFCETGHWGHGTRTRCWVGAFFYFTRIYKIYWIWVAYFFLHESHESARIFFWLAIRCQLLAISFYLSNLHFRFRKWRWTDYVLGAFGDVRYCVSTGLVGG